MRITETRLRRMIREELVALHEVAMMQDPMGRYSDDVLVAEGELDEWFKITGYEWDDQHNDGERQTQGGELRIDFTRNDNPYSAMAYVYAYTLSPADVVELITQAISGVDEENTLDMYLGEEDIKGVLGPMLNKIMSDLKRSQDTYQQAAANSSY